MAVKKTNKNVAKKIDSGVIEAELLKYIRHQIFRSSQTEIEMASLIRKTFKSMLNNPKIIKMVQTEIEQRIIDHVADAVDEYGNFDDFMNDMYKLIKPIIKAKFAENLKKT